MRRITPKQRLKDLERCESACNTRQVLRCLGDLYMGDQLSPAFHAEIILELFSEFGCFRKVSQRTGILLSGSSPEHLEAIGRHLPKELVHVLPRRQLRAA
jgi:hypothetical protein